MGVFSLHLVLAFLSVLWSSLRVPLDFHYGNATLFKYLDLSVPDFDRFFDEVNFRIDLDLSERNDKCFQGETISITWSPTSDSSGLRLTLA